MFLPCIIKSIREQTYGNIEWIIVDGNSSDKTVELIRRNEDVIDYWVSEPDNGIYDAWNKGLTLARGEWIAFLGSDDIYCADAIETYVTFINSHPDRQYDYISTKVELVTAKNELISIIGAAWNWPVFKKKMNVAHVGSLHHRSLFECYGSFDTSYKITGDYELLLRPRDTLRAGFINKVTARMRIGGASHNLLRAFAEAKRAKHTKGGRALLLCMLDNARDILKVSLKRIFIRKFKI
jgi:glycosyltransferase involved in cell wall biosynthesis